MQAIEIGGARGAIGAQRRECLAHRLDGETGAAIAAKIRFAAVTVGDCDHAPLPAQPAAARILVGLVARNMRGTASARAADHACGRGRHLRHAALPNGVAPTPETPETVPSRIPKLMAIPSTMRTVLPGTIVTLLPSAVCADHVPAPIFCNPRIARSRGWLSTVPMGASSVTI